MAKTLIEPTSTSADELRAMLLERRSAIQQEIHDLLAQYREHHFANHNDSVLDLEDMSLRDSTGEQQLSLLEARNRTRMMLDTALRRLDDGEYGLCEDCGAKISAGRLKPSLSQSVVCRANIRPKYWKKLRAKKIGGTTRSKALQPALPLISCLWSSASTERAALCACSFRLPLVQWANGVSIFPSHRTYT